MNLIYLDHNATTPLHPLVADAMHECDRAGYMNPASQHESGRQARRVLEAAREYIALTLGANISTSNADRVIFTSGGTESNNLALLGLVGSPPGKIVISSIEHPSVVGAAEHLRDSGFDCCKVRVSADGVVDLDHLRSLIDAGTRLVSVMWGNNETGVLQPVAEAAEICAERNVPLHVDAVQAVGKIPIHFGNSGAATLSATAHKFHGPRGIGILIIRSDVRLQPMLYGGQQQMQLRPGTESVTLAVGFQAALQLWQQEADERLARLATLRDQLEAMITAELPDAVVVGRNAQRLPHTSNISFPGLDRQAILLALDQMGVACSTGSACASGSSEPSPVLLAMGCPLEIVEGSIRLSLGALTTATETTEAAGRILRAIGKLRRRK